MHPFGDWDERPSKIRKGKPKNLKHMQDGPYKSCVQEMIAMMPEDRPTATKLMQMLQKINLDSSSCLGNQIMLTGKESM